MSDATETAVLTARKGAVAWVTLNRPHALNAINQEIREQLPRAIRAADEDPEVRVILLNGAGDRAFCAGADIKGFGDVGSLSDFRQSRAHHH